MSEPHDGHDEVSQYEYSGIEERHGHIPVWLGVVYAALAVFMVVYLLQYWTDKG
jgi:hypothetical protein